jgi:hypothetical protein
MFLDADNQTMETRCTSLLIVLLLLLFLLFIAARTLVIKKRLSAR